MSLYVGLDIGGTKFLVGAANRAGKILRRVRHKTPQGLSEGLALLDSMIDEVTEGEKILGMSAAVGGPLDWRTGIVSPLHQPQWRDVPLRERMEQRWHCRFRVDVDTNVAALGEYSRCNPKPQRLLYLTLSTGMGGGLLIDGQIHRGAGGEHPEVAHMSVNAKCSFPERVACECGAPDCLEALVSGNGIGRVYGKPAEELTDGEWDEVAWNLGQGMRNAATLYAPDVIVVGGGVAIGRGQRLIDTSRGVMEEHLRLVPTPQVSLSILGEDTALTGAIELARRG